MSNYKETYYDIYRLKQLVLEYATAKHHKRHPNVLLMKRQQIDYICNKIKRRFKPTDGKSEP
jgi:hypothetical protein